MTTTQARLHKRLVAERSDLTEQLEALDAEQRALAEDNVDSRASDQELGDCVSSRERETDLRLAAHVQDLYDKVAAAIGRLETGEYGLCTDCDKKIPAARLQALPYAEHCVTCQGRRERFYGA